MLGPSGSGKTTCLRLISGFEQPDAGHVRLFGEAAEGIPPNRRSVNTVFQDYALFPHLDVRDNVAYGPMVRGVPKAERHARAEEMLALVRLDGFGDRRPVAALGRPAPARRARPRARQRAARAPARRAARRARPQAPRGDAGRAEGDPAPPRHHLRLRHPRPGRGAVDGRPGRGLRPRPHRPGRHARRRSTSARAPASSPTSSAPRTCSRPPLAARFGASGWASLRPEAIRLDRGRPGRRHRHAPAATSAPAPG